MTTTKHTLTFALSLSLFACGHPKRNEQFRHNTIKKVTVAFSGFGCEGDCPFQALSVDKELNAFYYGGANAANYGYYKGQFKQSTWDSIKIRFDKFYNKGIDTAEYYKTDHPNVEFYITDSLNKKYFKENTGKMTNEDLGILHWFIRLASNTTALKHCDSLTFETTLQFPIFPKE